MISNKLVPFGTSVFGVMSALALEREAIDLSQGFPDFEGPPEIIEWAHEAMLQGHNQYPRPKGVVPLVTAIAERLEEHYGLRYDPLTEIQVTSGATEGICSTLLGLLKLFAEEIAQAKEIRYTPGYFPFTEPSVEVHIRHPRLGWMEMGGSGVFRPELTKPLGIDVPVIAWGLGVDRMAMVAMGIDNIRDLFSHDLDFLRNTKVMI